MKGDGFAQLVLQLTNVGSGDGVEFRDDALLPDADIVEQLAPALDDCVRDLFFLEELPRAGSSIFTFVPGGNIRSSRSATGQIFVNEESLTLRELRIRAAVDDGQGFDRFICHCV